MFLAVYKVEEPMTHMHFSRQLHRIGTILFSLLIIFPVYGQRRTIEVKRDQLLNGLNLLILPKANSSKSLIKLRIHSGAVFDLAGRDGTMALLGDALLPDQDTRKYIVEDLNGKVEVFTHYDYIDLTLSGNVTDFEKLLEIMRSSIMNMPLSAEDVQRLRDARIKVVKEISVSPSTIADRTISNRLFGKFPYARPTIGTPESLSKIGRGDLLLARERFLIPNNSTLVITGVEEKRAARAVRQLLGAWRRGDHIVPATFQQPETPDTRTLIYNLEGAESTEIRVATKGIPRSDRDQMAAHLIALLARDRWQKLFPELNKNSFFSRHDAYELKGIFIVGASVPTANAVKTMEAIQNLFNSLVTIPASTTELALIKNEAIATLNKKVDEEEAIADQLLDKEKYKTSSVDQIQVINSLTPTELQKVANKLLHKKELISVAVGNSNQLEKDLKKLGEVECINTISSTPTQVLPTTKRP
jgi:zinc protease